MGEVHRQVFLRWGKGSPTHFGMSVGRIFACWVLPGGVLAPTASSHSCEPGLGGHMPQRLCRETEKGAVRGDSGLAPVHPSIGRNQCSDAAKSHPSASWCAECPVPSLAWNPPRAQHRRRLSQAPRPVQVTTFPSSLSLVFSGLLGASLSLYPLARGIRSCRSSPVSSECPVHIRGLCFCA